MKGYPPGYPANRYQAETAARHAGRRNGRPPTATDLERIRQADQRRRGGELLNTRDHTDIAEGNGQ